MLRLDVGWLLVGGLCGWTWARAVIAERSRPPGLSERQTQILALVARGLSSKEIARHEGISQHSVNTHIRRARSTLGVSSRAAAAALVSGGAPARRRHAVATPPPARPSRSAARPSAITISPTSSSNGT